MVKQCSIPGVKYYSYNAAGLRTRLSEPLFSHHSAPAPGLWRRSQGKELASQGFEPDVVVVNTGWGENLFLKDIWPKARHVAYFEYYYHAKGQDLDFDPEFPVTNEEVIWRLRLKNSMQLGALDAADVAVAPTRYQRDTFPTYLRDRLAIIDGIDTHKLLPDPNVGSSSAGTG